MSTNIAQPDLMTLVDKLERRVLELEDAIRRVLESGSFYDLLELENVLLEDRQ